METTFEGFRVYRDIKKLVMSYGPVPYILGTMAAIV